MVEAQMKCETCRHFNSEEVYHCRRYPPAIVGGSNSVAFPITKPDWWCGEHAVKPELKAPKGKRP
jgi:hypothetical protein